VSDILTDRLVLRLVPLAGLAATVAHDLDACRRLIGPKLPEDWLAESWVAELRLNQWKENPDYAPWSIRAIARQADGQIVGYMNCHDCPTVFDHEGETGLMIEMGYTVFAPFRRHGYAFEAIGGLADFAGHIGVRWVRLSIAPGNAASLGLAEKLGAVKIGTQFDDRDGPEDVYLFDLD
jgi:ribosomal-protein-alanine N-acetyltransferase